MWSWHQACVYDRSTGAWCWDRSWYVQACCHHMTAAASPMLGTVCSWWGHPRSHSVWVITIVGTCSLARNRLKQLSPTATR